MFNHQCCSPFSISLDSAEKSYLAYLIWPFRGCRSAVTGQLFCIYSQHYQNKVEVANQEFRQYTKATGMGANKYASRNIPRISLADFNGRVDEITAQLVHAAETDGFFSLTDTEITTSEIDAIFGTSAQFFALPDELKATVPFTTNNVGWEKRGQIRPSVRMLLNHQPHLLC